MLQEVNQTNYTSRTMIAIQAFAAAFCLLFAMTAASAQVSEEKQLDRRAACNLGSLSGQYAIIGSGFAATGPPPAAPVPFATVSLLTADGAGNLTNQVTRSINGVISRGIDSGSYTINEDCTGTMTLITSTAPFPLTFDLVISSMRGVAFADEFYFIATSPGGTITASAKRVR